MKTSQSPGAFLIPERANKYEILDVDRDSTSDDLRVAYRRLALVYHPDRHPEAEKEQAAQLFRQIAAAYKTLSDPAERRRYDLSLERNEEFNERPGDVHEVSLAEILEGIDAYEHIFSEGSVAAISTALHQIVQNHLISELGEQVVEAWRLPAAPEGVTHKGSFQEGALVLTNVRVLLPYTFTWTETHGNVKTTYTGAGMPVLPLPMLEYIAVVAEKRVKRKLWVDFRHQDGTTRIRPRRTNLSKLLLVAQLWGVRVVAHQEDAKASELRWALLSPWKWGTGAIAVLMTLAAVVGFFSDGMLDEMADLADFFRNWGIWQWTALLCAAISGNRLRRWVSAYSTRDLAETLETPTPPPTSEISKSEMGNGAES